MENRRFCQSCAMPMTQLEHFGTNADGSANEDYCCYCFQDGKFLSNCTMEEMLLDCIDMEMREIPGSSIEEVRVRLTAIFPTLKRWKKE